jgi:hypothetical protein
MPQFAEFRRRGASFVTGLSFIDDNLRGFELADRDGYALAFAQVRPGQRSPPGAAG